MTYRQAIEKRDFSKIDKLNMLTNKDTFWEELKYFTKYVTSDHAIGRWQCLAEYRYNELTQQG